MPSKKQRHDHESRVALALELAVLLLVTAWTAALLFASPDKHTLNSEVHGVRTLVGALVLLLVAAGAFAQLTPMRMPEQFCTAFRPERDAGLAVGCALVPLVLLSQLLTELYQNHTLSACTYLYAWTSVSVAWSALVRLVVLRSASLHIAIAVDLVVAPVLMFIASLPTTTASDAALRCVLPAFCQCAVTVVFTFGVRALRRSFTLGEALLVAQGVGMLAFDLALYSALRIARFDVTATATSVVSTLLGAWNIDAIERADYVLALQVGVVSSLLVCVALVPLLRAYGASTPSIVAAPLPLLPSVAFVLIAAAVVGGVAYPWSCLVLATHDPFTWLATFLLAHDARLLLIVYWLACLAVLVPLCAVVVDRFAVRTIVARKLFHALVVVMFVPAAAIDVPMLTLSYGVALSVFCLVECVRAVSLPPLGGRVAAFMQTFIDHRDAGRVVLTHSYLLLGCALPLWLSLPSTTSAIDAQAAGSHTTTVVQSASLAANAGIVALGVGDAMGATVGSICGSRRLIGSKTLEGSLAIFVSMLLASVFFHDYHVQALQHGQYEQLVLLVAGVALTSVLETCTAQIDNLVLPLFFFAVCNLVACHRSSSSSP